MDIGISIGTYTIILCESLKNDRNKFKLIFVRANFGLILPFFKLIKELDGDKVESWAKGLSDRWINNDDLKRKGIQKHSRPDLLPQLVDS